MSSLSQVNPRIQFMHSKRSTSQKLLLGTNMQI